LLFVSCTQLPIEDQTTEVVPVDNVEENEGNIALIDTEGLDSITELEQVDPQIIEQSGAIEDLSEETAEALNETPVISGSEISNETIGELGMEEALTDEAAESEGGLNENEEVLFSPEELARIDEELRIHQRNIEELCEEIGRKLGSVSVEDCLTQELEFAGAYSVNARPLAMRDFHPRSESDANTKVLIMGGIHGDEYSSISIMFKWMSLIQKSGGNSYTWRFLPSVNPDGLLDGQAVRQNTSGVDLNRNFPSQDWDAAAIEYWRNNTGENPRRYPGQAAASEPEVRWIIEQIEKFDPEVIVSVYAPYHLLDFDGPSQAPDKIGDLYLHQLSVYPGSLGNYAGLDLGIPVVTLELPSAGIMPSVDQIETMWIDMVTWLNNRSQIGQQAGL